MSDKPKLAGEVYIDTGTETRILPVYVVTQPVEHADAVICLNAEQTPTEIAAENIWTTCHYCGILVSHRPLAPTKPPKVCTSCAVKYVLKIPDTRGILG
jgi:hypothetical protein